MIETKNPYTRLRELCGIGHREFARKYEIAKQTLVGMESGQYTDLSDKMIVCLGKECYEKGVNAKATIQREYLRDGLQEAYHAWQHAQRLTNKDRLDIDLSSLIWDKDTSPFKAFMRETAGSAQGFAKAYCLPGATLARYADGRTSNMPKGVTKALVEAEMQSSKIGQLQVLQEEWLNGR